MSVKKTNSTMIFSVLLLVVSVVLSLGLTFFTDGEFTAFYLMKDIPIYFHIDALGKWFIAIVSIVWLSVGLYSMVYMKHEGGEKRFYIFYLLLYWVLIGLNAAGNLVTMYMFYEFMSLVSYPLVMHNGSKEAIMASL